MTDEMDLKLEEMKQLHELEGWKIKNELEKSRNKRKKANGNFKIEDVLIGLSVLVGGGIAAAALDKYDVFKNNPEQKWFWERLAKTQPKINLEPVRALERQDRKEVEKQLNPHHTRELRPKWNLSSTTTDPTSVRIEAEREALKERYKPEIRKKAVVVPRQTPQGKLGFSSGGGHAYGKQELEAMDRRAKESLHTRGS